MPASLRSDPGRLAPEQAVGIPPDSVAEITGIRMIITGIIGAILGGSFNGTSGMFTS